MNSEENLRGVINAWTEEGTSDNDDNSVLNIRTIYDDNGIETKKLVIIGLCEDAILNMNIPVDSASPVSLLKQNALHELKLRVPQLKILPVDKKIHALYCGFTKDTIKFIGKIQRMHFRRNSIFHHHWTREEHLGKRQLIPICNRNCAETTVTSGEHRISSGFV